MRFVIAPSPVVRASAVQKARRTVTQVECLQFPRPLVAQLRSGSIVRPAKLVFWEALCVSLRGGYA